MIGYIVCASQSGWCQFSAPCRERCSLLPESAPNVETAGWPMGDPHPCDISRYEKQGISSLDIKYAPSAELWVESPTDFMEGWGGKELPPSFHAYAERLYKAYKTLAESAQSATGDRLEALDCRLAELANRYMNTVEDYYCHGIWKARDEISKIRRSDNCAVDKGNNG